jgi:hypothetical protein
MKRLYLAILFTVSVIVVIGVALTPSLTQRPGQQSPWFWDQTPTQRQPSDVINSWLMNETQVWLNKDPTHKISVMIWPDASYLGVHGINRTDVVEWLQTEHNATDLKMSSWLQFITAGIPASQVFQIYQAPVIEFMDSGSYPFACEV